MTGRMSKEKGKAGEREFAELLRTHGFSEARRGQQFSGISGEDVIGLPGFHIEVKRNEAFHLYPAMEQSKEDAKIGEIPIVAHRPNRHEWIIVIHADDFLKFVKNKAKE
jgi:Holliday junction resolvase